ncbi:hypothetical protein FBY34_7677 [Streptomyces sp. SLBN-115]|nr:hypothetical protein FBY34_7677 [Streptomyces sp. SLBN-115]
MAGGIFVGAVPTSDWGWFRATGDGTLGRWTPIFAGR